MGDISTELVTIKSVEDVVTQVASIKRLMQEVMVKDLHYGIIPGTEKPTLLQPGAQKLCLTFRVGDRDLEMTERDLPGGHREYKFHKQFVYIPTGEVLTEAWGTCSTMESRYRWRKSYETLDLVPKPYWTIPKDDMVGKQNYLVAQYGPGKYRTRKVEGEWRVVRLLDERKENPDIEDQYNTVMAVASKRAYVRGTIKALAASDLFTHDLEDFADQNGEGGGNAGDAGRQDPGTVDARKDAKNAGTAEDVRKRKGEEGKRQKLIEKIAFAVQGEDTKRYFTQTERSIYVDEIKSGGQAGKSLPTAHLKTLVVEVEEELERRKKLPEKKLAELLSVKGLAEAAEDMEKPVEEKGAKDDLDKAAEAGWDPKKDPPRRIDPDTGEIIKEELKQGDLY